VGGPSPRPGVGAGVVLVALKVVPGASRSRVVGRLGDRWKVAVSSAPERGAANEEVERLLASAVGVRPAAVRIVSGHGSPRKTAAVAGTTPEALSAALERARA
jgi:uncharacterized protein YggU (UPF0235/DUF167 family)